MGNRRMWKTKEGKKVRIRDIDDQHLVNTIRMLEKFATIAKDRTLSAALSMSSFINGEMASLCIEQDIARMEDSEPYEFLDDPSMYEDLVTEAERRHLAL